MVIVLPAAVPIRLIVGLGNVGRDYERTRHNAGFWFADEAARHFGGNFSNDKKFFAEVARGLAAGADLWLLKPTTFMNRSGLAVQAFAQFYRIAPHEMLVVHDELDLPPGTTKLKRGGGHAGHNGLRDIQSKLGSADFWRLRLGIGHPRTLLLEQPVVDFVLHPPAKDELAAIEAGLDRTIDILPHLARGEFERAMMRLHGVRND